MTLNYMLAELPLGEIFTKEAAERQRGRIGDFLTFRGPLGNELGFAEILDVTVRRADPETEYFNVTYKIKAHVARSPEDMDEMREERLRLTREYGKNHFG